MDEAVTGSTGTRFTPLNDHDGPLLVLAGSLGADRSMWSGWAESLCGSRRVVAVEWPGHGAGEIRRPFTVEDLADDLHRYLEGVGAERVSYCGLSLGGAVGQAFLSRRPGRLEAAVLVAAGLTFASPGALAERARAVCRDGMLPLAQASLERWFAPVGAGSAQAVRRRHLEHMERMEPLGYALNCLALAVFDGGSYSYRGTDRVLVVGGADDQAVPARDVTRMAQVVGAERCELLPGAGHLVNVDQPRRFAEVVEEFLGI